jgi:hypothetical protein
VQAGIVALVEAVQGTIQAQQDVHAITSSRSTSNEVGDSPGNTAAAAAAAAAAASEQLLFSACVLSVRLRLATMHMSGRIESSSQICVPNRINLVTDAE